MIDQPALILSGLAMSISLIAAIGAQNAFVLRQGLRREHVGVVVALCMTFDAVFISLGIATIGWITGLHPGVLDALRYAGAAYLLWFAFTSFRSALRPQALETDSAPSGRGSLRRVITTTVAVSALNPHVYLDTVVLLGSVANQHGPEGRWWFGLGAMAGSVVWFNALGWGAHALAPKLAHPRTWQVVDVLVGVIMLILAVRLLLG